MTTASLKIYDGLFVSPDDESLKRKPFVEGNTYLLNGKVHKYEGKLHPVHSPILVKGTDEPTVIGNYPMMNEKDALAALDATCKAFDFGRGQWPLAKVTERIAAVERFIEGIKRKRSEIINLIMWEICKTEADATKEVDRTIMYMQDTITAYKDLENKQSTFVRQGGVMAQIRRTPIGVVMCVSPFNYPFNETYTTLIPALLMGNCVVMKLPRTGVLCHWPTFDLFADCFPAGVINILSGSGRETMPPIMKTGRVDILAFIGTSKAASSLQKAHPQPHRLRICLGLEAKNPAIVFPDADLEQAVSEVVAGSLSYNGQRCTALKILFVHKDIEQAFLDRYVAAVDKLKIGMPWEAGVKITPLPEESKPGYLQELIDDATSKGAKVINARGGKVDRTIVAPTVLFPVDASMRVYNEEQFGPLVPIRTWSRPEEVYDYLAASPYGQQASVFGQDAAKLAPMIDVLVNQVSRVNINSQCQRGPDVLPFTGRKDSAYGTLSVSDALRVFSIRSLLAAKEEGATQKVISDILAGQSSNFLRLDYLF